MSGGAVKKIYFPTCKTNCISLGARVLTLMTVVAVLAFAESASYKFRVVNALSEVGKVTWNSLQSDNPFLSYDWLNSLESSGCAAASTGWQPLHVVVEKEGQVIAGLPLYAKYHSQGEFIFDQSWADFAGRVLGARYYPKLLCAVPFTPATGPRLLLSPAQLTDEAERQEVMLAMGNFLANLARDNNLLSANINYMTKDDASLLQQSTSNYMVRNTIQFRFQNRNPETGEKYKDFEDYLSYFKSKRRMQIKRERKSVYEDQRCTIEAIRGDSPLATPELYETMFQLYTTTIEKMWGSQYLNSKFFAALSQCDSEFRKNLLFIILRNSKGDICGGTFNVVSSTTFYGRYWGYFPQQEYIKFAHFAVCYYAAIEYVIKERLESMEPGSGGGDFKYLRGFDPFLINSVHCFPTSREMDAAVRKFLEQERAQNSATADYLQANSALRPAGQ